MKNFFTGNKIKILLHLLAWSIILGLPLYFFKEMGCRKRLYMAFLYWEHNQWNNILFKLSDPCTEILFREPEA